MAFWKTLSKARATLQRTFYDGRASRDLDFKVTFEGGAEADIKGGLRRSAPLVERGWGGAHGLGHHGSDLGAARPVGLEFDAVAGAVWVDDQADAGSLTVVFVGVSRDLEAAEVTATLDASRFGLALSDAEDPMVGVFAVDLSSGEESLLGTFPACCVEVNVLVGVRGVTAVRMRPVEKAAAQ